jgi:outer membrane protein, multidrug efflux system
LGVAAGCALGPNYTRPPITPPDAFYEEAAAAEAASFADAPWWEVFHEPTLEALIAEALAKGYDPQIAAWRVEEARALAGIARSEFFPQIGYQAQFERGRASDFSVSPPTASRPVNFHTVNVNAAWEIDLWGRIRRLNEAARAQFMAAEDNRRGVLLTLVASVAQAYCELRELDAELLIARRNVTAFEQTRDLFQRRLDAGVASALETARAEAALAQVAAQVPILESQIVDKENQLSFLLGRNPGPIERGAALAELPVAPDVPAGLPSALLERRPDLREAEQNLVAANADVGVAMANFFPAISLTGLFGGLAPDVSDLFGPGKVWSIAAGLLGPLFQGGRLRSEYDASVARWNQVRLQYEQVVVAAFGDVSSALVAKQKFAESESQQALQVAALQESVRLSNLRYISGLADYFEVLDAQQQLFPAEIALSQARRDQLVATVRLYRVLGGGWNLADPTWAPPKAVPVAAAGAP